MYGFHKNNQPNTDTDTDTSTLLIIKMFLEQQIIILEWFLKKSCDTEDWSNGCWKFSFALEE